MKILDHVANSPRSRAFSRLNKYCLFFYFRHKGGQVSPQNTEVTQFVSSDIDIQSDQNAQSSSVAILQGRLGTPAGKLPPIKSVVRSSFHCKVYMEEDN